MDGSLLLEFGRMGVVCLHDLQGPRWSLLVFKGSFRRSMISAVIGIVCEIIGCRRRTNQINASQHMSPTIIQVYVIYSKAFPCMQ